MILTVRMQRTVSTFRIANRAVTVAWNVRVEVATFWRSWSRRSNIPPATPMAALPSLVGRHDAGPSWRTRVSGDLPN